MFPAVQAYTCQHLSLAPSHHWVQCAPALPSQRSSEIRCCLLRTQMLNNITSALTHPHSFFLFETRLVFRLSDLFFSHTSGRLSMQYRYENHPPFIISPVTSFSTLFGLSHDTITLNDIVKKTLNTAMHVNPLKSIWDVAEMHCELKADMNILRWCQQSIHTKNKNKTQKPTTVEAACVRIIVSQKLFVFS